jgi:hypothetical protein
MKSLSKSEETDKSPIRPTVCTLQEIISDECVTIPEYQRPYKWSTKNVNQLIDDLLLFKEKDSYRLGTLVYHLEDKKLHLVDGQQRSVTFALIALAISEDERLQKLLNKNRYKQPENTSLQNFEFRHPISKQNIKANYREIQRRLKDFDYHVVVFFFERCEAVKVVLSDISEAFQFFDSQNARGKDLDPHDLLKAFHLRELNGTISELETKKMVADWEDLESKKLARTFSEYLFRIRFWSKGKSARFFTKSEVDEFKGVSPAIDEPFPYANIYRIVHYYVEGYNADYQRNIDRNKMSFPFQIDQVVINGKRFFEMIAHYNQLIQSFEEKEGTLVKKKSIAYEILETINTYRARTRTGDQYVRNLFNTALLYYLDKFGKVEIERAIEKIFVWAYGLRLERQNVQLASMDNRAIERPYVFKRLKEALQPSEFLSFELKPLKRKSFEKSNRSGKLNKLVSLFDQLNYLDQ